ncbi:hypothetical protein ScPMuIL_006512 [Solemya velum]
MADGELEEHVSSASKDITPHAQTKQHRNSVAYRMSTRLKSCLVWFVSSLGILSWTVGCLGVTGERDVPEMTVQSTCKTGTTLDQYLMVVSTIDGKVSALDVRNNGRLAWSVQADTRALLSSSISKLEMTRNGVPVRFIPSLDGGLYQYDGENIEAVPLTADSLLSSSFKLADDTMMVGGKDLHTYGINPYTGQIQYSCTTEGCRYFGEGDVENDGDVLVITRNTQTVRAIDSRTGSEKWNFSVGQHELTFLEGQHPRYAVTNEIIDDEDVTVEACPDKDEHVNEEERARFEGNLKVIVPKGLVVGLNPNNEDIIEWQYKFASPVASAWILHKGELRPISIFDRHHMPALSCFEPEENMSQEPVLYIGSHQKQLYVMPSLQLQEQAAEAVSQSSKPSMYSMPKVAWEPYLITAASRTPIMRGNVDSRTNLISVSKDEEEVPETSVSVWHENYPYDRGYYIYSQKTTKLPITYDQKAGNMSHKADSADMEAFAITLWNWWKEVVAISVVSSLLVHILLTRYVHQQYRVSQKSLNSHSTKIVMIFSCRYNTDFEHLQCLGRGGFGIVFQAKKKVDECDYAVKRIGLPDTSASLKSWIKEINSIHHANLLKLNRVPVYWYYMTNYVLDSGHFHMTAKPPGTTSKEILKVIYECFSNPTPCNSISENWAVTSPAISKDHIINILRPFGGSPDNFESSLDIPRAGSSTEFSIIEEESDSENDESGSFSIGKPSALKLFSENNNSIEIEFKHSDTEASADSTNNIPFQTYAQSSDAKIRIEDTNESIDIVFEDSGCGEKSSNSDSNKNVNHNNCVSESALVSRTSACSNNQCVPKLYLFIQMQLCQRETLKDWLAANAYRDYHLILDIFDQIVSAVEYVHDNSLMHRDLKPSNIFFSREGVIKVGDFGLATAMAEQQDSDYSSGSDKHGKHTAQVGTQIYMSPEQILGRVYSHKVDIFALGVILFELFYPFATQMERVKILSEVKEKVFPKKFREEKPKEAEFVAWLVNEEPDCRPSAKQILDSEFLRDFQPRRQPRTFRSRTISGDSDNSGKS